MKRSICILAAFVLFSILTGGGMAAFQDVNSPQFYLDWKKTGAAVDANFALIETGGVDIAAAAIDMGAEANLILGDSSSNGVAGTVSGDVTFTTDNTNHTSAISAGVIVNTDVSTNAAIELIKLGAVAPAWVIVGNASSQAVAVAVSGAVSIDTNGVTVINAGGPTNIIVGNAASNGISGPLSGDVVISTDGTNHTSAIVTNVIIDADINSTAAIAHTKLAAVDPGYVIVGNATSQAVAVVISGAVSVGDSGATALTTGGLGTPVAGVASATEAGEAIVFTTITLTNVVLIATNGSDEGESAKVFDADDGVVSVLMSVVNCSIISSAGATNVFVVSFGTAAAGDDGTLTGTEADIIPSTSIDTTGGTVLTNAFDAILAAPAIFDGTSSGIEIYVNLGILNTNMADNVTNVFSGTLILKTPVPVDNQ